MADTISGENVTAMLRSAVATIRENEGMLSKLDAVTGDGDHGSAMAKAAAVVSICAASSRKPLVMAIFASRFGSINRGFPAKNGSEAIVSAFFG